MSLPLITWGVIYSIASFFYPIQHHEEKVLIGGALVSIHTYQTKLSCHQRPLLLLSGGPGCPHDYLSNLKTLATKRPLIFYDPFGSGNSQAQEEISWDFDKGLQELEGVIEHKKLKTFDLLGHSFGASLAVEYAAQNPKRVHKLVLASPLLSTPLWLEETQAMVAALDPLVKKTIVDYEAKQEYGSTEYQEACHIFYQKHFCRLNPWPDLLMASMSKLNAAVYHKLWGPSEFTANGQLAHFDCMGHLPLLEMPVLITGGAYDEACPETLKKAVSKLPQGKLHLFSKSAHVAHLEEEKAYKKGLDSFLLEKASLFRR